MASTLDLNLIVKHIAHGTIGENLCRVCLLPLADMYENVFTKICKLNEEFCIADILKELCNIQILETDHYNVCSDCFVAATNAYKFYLNMKRSEEILQYYVDDIQSNLDFVSSQNEEAFMANSSLCITLPAISPEINIIEVKPENVCVSKEIPIKKEQMVKVKIESTEITKKPVERTSEQDFEDLVVVMDEKGNPMFYLWDEATGDLVEVEYDDRCRMAYKAISDMPKQKPRRRVRMTWKKCSQCNVEYRFLSKLKDHMWSYHGVKLLSCKICEALMEDEDEYKFHMSTHSLEYECDKCKVTFKKRHIIIDHLRQHNKLQGTVKKDLVCKECGLIFKKKNRFEQHMEDHNHKEYTCYYCGRMYKKEIGFNNHIKKHEMYLKLKEAKKKQADKFIEETKKSRKTDIKKESQRELTCEQCGKSFLSHRALLWHSRLHTNERPFVCDECGRRFVSLNRRNQHALCAHTAPARRCPLCPALFHMTSMVNTHIKKVHLKVHKRRSRTVRAPRVAWPTAPVPLQDLSVPVQQSIIDLQTREQTTNNNE